MKEIMIILFFILVCIIIIGVNIYKRHRKGTVISFKESMDLVELPVITFYSNNKKLNFLLDTGSDNSYINKSAMKGLEYHECGNTSVIGMEGNKADITLCTMSLKYKDHIFTDNFGVLDLNDAFHIVKQESGVTIHGILGSKFFQKYKYILDFKKLAAYIR